jgi:hypothetical protein
MKDRPRSRLARLASSIAVAMLVSVVPVAASAADPAQAQSAEQLAAEAYDLHAAGKYPEAIAAYFRAYELSQAGAILFNIATIYDRKLHERQLAADFYRRYLLAPDTEQGLVKKATERLAALKRETEEEANAKKNIPPPPPPEAAPGPAASPSPAASPNAAEQAPEDKGGGGAVRGVGFTLGAVGLVGLGTGIVLGLVAKSKNDQANTFCHGAACTDQRGVTDAQQAGDFATASTATFIPGLVLLVGGVTMVLAAPSHKGAPSSKGTGITFGPMLGTTGAGLSAHGTF